MHIGARHLAISRDRAVRDTIDDRRRPHGVRAGGSAEMDFVAFERQIELDRARTDIAHRLLRFHHRFNVEQAEPLSLGDVAFDAIGIAHPTAKHLKTAANADDMAAALAVRGQIPVPAILAEFQEITDRRLGAGNDHQPGIGR